MRFRSSLSSIQEFIFSKDCDRMQGPFIVCLRIYDMLVKINNSDSSNSINAVIKKQSRRLKDDRIKATDIISWDNTMGKKVRSIGGEDIGKVENVYTYFIEVKDELLAKRHYYVPKYSIRGFDGRNNLITVMTKEEIKNEFSADNPVADLWQADRI
jgi:hypothetical protein